MGSIWLMTRPAERQWDLRGQPHEAILYALGSGVLYAFAIGAESVQEQNDLWADLGG